MKENPALIAAAAWFVGDERGTPAGNAGLTQEQLAVLRERGLSMGDVAYQPVLVRAAPPCPGTIPDEHRAQAEMVMMNCPIMGCQLMAPGDRRPLILLPDGRLATSLS